jgi:hypothetical protein
MRIADLDKHTRARLTLATTAIGVMILLGALLVAPAFSYVLMYTRTASGSAQPDHWDFSSFAVTYSINPSSNGEISGSQIPADVVNAAFSTWIGAPNTAVAASRGADSSLTKSGYDGVNLICFVCSGDFSQDASTLAVTITTVADAPGEDTKHGGTSKFAGQILDADILFNPTVQFSTGGASGQDLQTIATHEVGHFFGLDHSGVVRSIMFPFAPDLQTTLSYDDVAGMSSIYPKSTVDVPVGSISGRIMTAGGTPVFGAHVFAESTTTNVPFPETVRKSPIAALTGPDGTYTIGGVPVDSYTVTAEPLDDPMTNGDISGFASAFGKGAVQTNFNTRWH